MVKQISYYRWVVIDLLVAILINQLSCEREFTATGVAIAKRHDYNAVLAQGNCISPIWWKTKKTSLQISVKNAWAENLMNAMFLLLRTKSGWSWFYAVWFPGGFFHRNSSFCLVILFWCDVSAIPLPVNSCFSNWMNSDVNFKKCSSVTWNEIL